MPSLSWMLQGYPHLFHNHARKFEIDGGVGMSVIFLSVCTYPYRTKFCGKPCMRLPSKNTYNEVSAHPLIMTAFKHYNPDRPFIFKRRMSFLLERHVAPTYRTDTCDRITRGRTRY